MSLLRLGANQVGLTSILFSSLAKKIYAFEPSPTTFRILEDNLSRAQAANVHAVNLGLGEREEQLTITFAKNNRSGGFVSDKIQPKEGHVTEQIRINSLDNHFRQLAERIAFLKIDVEGFELNVIKGAQALLNKSKPVVAMELNHFCLNALRRIAVPDFFDFLRAVFPYLYAIDTDNASIRDLHDETQAYHVMYEHILRFRFPNLVAGFDPSLAVKLRGLEKAAKQAQVSNPTARPNPPIAAKLNGFQRLARQLLTGQSAVTTSIPAITDARGWIKLMSPPRVSRPGEVFFLDVIVSNQSNCAWITSGDKPVRLSYHWQDTTGNSVIYDGKRSQIGVKQILPAEEIVARMSIVAPAVSGEFDLVITIVQDGICWFENCEFQPFVARIVVAT